MEKLLRTITIDATTWKKLAQLKLDLDARTFSDLFEKMISILNKIDRANKK